MRLRTRLLGMARVRAAAVCVTYHRRYVGLRKLWLRCRNWVIAALTNERVSADLERTEMCTHNAEKLAVWPWEEVVR